MLFIAFDKASFMTGSYVNVDGGMMAVGAWAGTEPQRLTPSLHGKT